MNLNYTAFVLIAFIPLILAVLWYHPNSTILKWSGEKALRSPLQMNPFQWILAFVFSFLFVYGYINLIIHQMGFYELFFTDIMKGSQEAQQVVDDFLAIYGDKHRHFGHGVFHGAINAFVFVLPLLIFFTFLEKKSFKYILLHLSYWLVTSMLIGGLISEFV